MKNAVAPITAADKSVVTITEPPHIPLAVFDLAAPPIMPVPVDDSKDVRIKFLTAQLEREQRLIQQLISLGLVTLKTVNELRGKWVNPTTA